jgi:predicted dehydrogenase
MIGGVLPIRVGVIGVGYLGQHHARIYSQIKDTELTAVVDTDQERAGTFAEKYRCVARSDYREILHKVDALSIVTPTTFHYRIALECLRAGKDILIEKPITENIKEADELIMESEEHGCILQVGHLERYNPALLAASCMIKEPRFIESERLSPFLGRGTDVDVTLDLMIHDADIVLAIMSQQINPPLPPFSKGGRGGIIKEIRAVGAKVFTDKIDVAKAWIEFENSCVAVLTASRLSPDKQRILRVFQEDSYLSVDFQKNEIKRYSKTVDGLSSDIIKPDNKEPLREELEDFVRCVKERKRPKVSAIEARKALQMVLDITEIIRKREG